MIVESDDREKNKHLHNVVVDSFERLLESPGWRMLAEAIERDMLTAFQKMGSATTGDEAMKASTAYVTIRNILELPRKEMTISMKRLQQIQEEEAAPPPRHHRKT